MLQGHPRGCREGDLERKAGDSERGPESDQTQWAAVGEHAGYGLTWAFSVLFFLLIGWWLDGIVGTMPFLTILGAFVGGAAGFYSLYRHVKESFDSPHGTAGESLDSGGKERSEREREG